MRHKPDDRSACLLIHAALLCALVAILNFAIELKDREIYRLYFDALDTCDGLACLLISDDLRSPVFLSLLIGAHRLGISLDALFAGVSAFSIATIARSLQHTNATTAATRFLYLTLFLGVWLYLIQVKLCLAVALYLASGAASRRWLRVALIALSVLVHESILFVLLLAWLWHSPKLSASALRLALPFALLGLLSIAVLHSLGVLEAAWQRVEHYNELVSVGDVPAIARTSAVSALLLGVAATGVLLHLNGELSLKLLGWMAVPWLTLIAFANNEVFALRLSELALLHLLLVVPLSRKTLAVGRVSFAVLGVLFGGLVFVKDVVLS